MTQEIRSAGLLRADVEHRSRRIPVIETLQPVQATPVLHVGNRLDVKDKQIHCFEHFTIYRKDAQPHGAVAETKQQIIPARPLSDSGSRREHNGGTIGRSPSGAVD
jgi:hypothetical protein